MRSPTCRISSKAPAVLLAAAALLTARGGHADAGSVDTSDNSSVVSDTPSAATSNTAGAATSNTASAATSNTASAATSNTAGTATSNTASAGTSNTGGITISGILWDGFERYSVAGHPFENRVSDQASRIIIAGRKSVGYGLTAWFSIDNRLALDLGQSGPGIGFAAGPSGIGFQGPFGKLTIGRWDVHYIESANVEAYRCASLQGWQGFGPMAQAYTGVVAGYANAMVVNRVSNLLMWDSNSLAGVTVRIAYSPDPGVPFTSANQNEGTTYPDRNGSKGQALSAAVRYASGPITAGVSLWNAKAQGSTNFGDTRSVRSWLALSFVGIKAGVLFDQSEARLAANVDMTTRAAWMIPISYQLGKHKAYFTYVMMGRSKDATGTIPNSDATALTGGYDYQLFKGTYVGAFYSRLDNKPTAAYNLFGLSVNGATLAKAGNTAKQMYFGARYDF